jgi:hypothetical protein
MRTGVQNFAEKIPGVAGFVKWLGNALDGGERQPPIGKPDARMYEQSLAFTKGPGVVASSLPGNGIAQLTVYSKPGQLAELTQLDDSRTGGYRRFAVNGNFVLGSGKALTREIPAGSVVEIGTSPEDPYIKIEYHVTNDIAKFLGSAYAGNSPGIGNVPFYSRPQDLATTA